MKPENLISLADRTPEERAEIGRKGGIKSGEAKREKKLLSSIYADILADEAGLGEGLDIQTVVREIIKKGGSSAVQMLKEVRESTEGSSVNLTGGINVVYLDKQDESL